MTVHVPWGASLHRGVLVLYLHVMEKSAQGNFRYSAVFACDQEKDPQLKHPPLLHPILSYMLIVNCCGWVNHFCGQLGLNIIFPLLTNFYSTVYSQLIKKI